MKIMNNGSFLPQWRGGGLFFIRVICEIRCDFDFDGDFDFDFEGTATSAT